MTRRKVLYAVTDPVTALAFLRGQLAYLTAHGFDVHLACRETSDLRVFAKTEGVTLHHVPLSRTWLSRDDLRALGRAVVTLRRVRPDVLNYSTPKASLVWAVASWFSRPALVVLLLRGLRLEGEKPRSPAAALLWLMEFIAARSAHSVVCVSESLRDRAVALRIVRASNANVLGAGSSNGVDTRRFTPIAHDERERVRVALGIEGNDFVIGYVGRLARDKGLRELLEAVEQLKGWGHAVRCILVGSEEDGFSLKQELELHPDAALACLHRPATNEVEREYAAFDVFVLPSYREGMSNALLEAQARGLPCVSTNATGCADALEPGITGLVVPPRDGKAIARAVAALAADPELRIRMGDAGRDRVTSKFRPEGVWDRFAALYGGRAIRSPSASSGRVA